MYEYLFNGQYRSTAEKWFYPNQTITKHEQPYSYSPFFLIGDHESIEDASSDYTDRYQLWDQEKYKKAIAAIGRQCRWNQMTLDEFNLFVKAYYGEEYECVGVVEWCNISSGYPTWSIHFKKVKKE